MQTQQAPQQIQVDAATPLTVTLAAGQWSAVLFALGKRKFEQVAPLIGAINEQLGQSAAQKQPHPMPNGLDHGLDHAA